MQNLERRSLLNLSMGLVAGGLISGGSLWLLSGLADPLPWGWRMMIAALVGPALVAREFGVLSFPVPQNARQVPQAIFARGALSAALQFGFELGVGVRTYMPSSAPYALAVSLVLLSSHAQEFILGGIGFGLGRAAMPLFRYWSGDGDGWDASLHGALGLLTRGATLLCAIGPVLMLIQRPSSG